MKGYTIAVGIHTITGGDVGTSLTLDSADNGDLTGLTSADAVFATLQNNQATIKYVTQAKYVSATSIIINFFGTTVDGDIIAYRVERSTAVKT
jgi:hypothetical protein